MLRNLDSFFIFSNKWERYLLQNAQLLQIEDMNMDQIECEVC